MELFEYLSCYPSLLLVLKMNVKKRRLLALQIVINTVKYVRIYHWEVLL